MPSWAWPVNTDGSFPIFHKLQLPSRPSPAKMKNSIGMQLVKERLSSAPVLALPDYTDSAEPFILDVDAGGFGIGAVLSQQQDGVERVISYGSARLTKVQRNYSVTERELLAFVQFAHHFRYYLLGRPFLDRTDHTALQWLMSLKEPRGRCARCLEKLSELKFSVIHQPGRQHTYADALSRRAAAYVASVTSSSESPTVHACSETTAKIHLQNQRHQQLSLSLVMPTRSPGCHALLLLSCVLRKLQILILLLFPHGMTPLLILLICFALKPLLFLDVLSTALLQILIC